MVGSWDICWLSYGYNGRNLWASRTPISWLDLPSPFFPWGFVIFLSDDRQLELNGYLVTTLPFFCSSFFPLVFLFLLFQTAESIQPIQVCCSSSGFFREPWFWV